MEPRELSAGDLERGYPVHKEHSIIHTISWAPELKNHHAPVKNTYRLGQLTRGLYEIPSCTHTYTWFSRLGQTPSILDCYKPPLALSHSQKAAEAFQLLPSVDPIV